MTRNERSRDAPADSEAPDEEAEAPADDGGETEEGKRATVEEVEHTHPHTDETFDRTAGVHGRGEHAEDESDES